MVVVLVGATEFLQQQKISVIATTQKNLIKEGIFITYKSL
jgi:hypothetical protein